MPLATREIQIDGLTFEISRFPCIEGREIMAQYVLCGIHLYWANSAKELKSFDYQANEALMLRMMSFVSIKEKDQKIRLISKDVLNNKIISDDPWFTLIKLEKEMIEYNWSFFATAGSPISSGISPRNSQCRLRQRRPLPRMYRPKRKSDVKRIT